MLERIKRIPFVVKMLRRVYPSCGTCQCCGLPWEVAEPYRFVDIPGTNQSFFVICEHCYKTKSKEELLDAYKKAWEEIFRQYAGNGFPVKDRLSYMKLVKKDISRRK